MEVEAPNYERLADGNLCCWSCGALVHPTFRTTHDMWHRWQPIQVVTKKTKAEKADSVADDHATG